MALIIAFVNKSSLAPVSDYAVEVLIGDGTAAHSKTIYRGMVRGHKRAEGWQALVRQWLEDLPRESEAEETLST
jgi:hypothetical protein